MMMKIDLKVNGSVSDKSLRKASSNIKRRIHRHDIVKLDTLIVFARFSVTKRLMDLVSNKKL